MKTIEELEAALTIAEERILELQGCQVQPVQEPGVVTRKEVTDTMNLLLRGNCKHVQMAQLMAYKNLYLTPPAQRKPLTDEREAFEAHRYTKYHAGSVSARSDGSYVHPHMQQAWEAWQARAAQE